MFKKGSIPVRIEEIRAMIHRFESSRVGKMELVGLVHFKFSSVFCLAVSVFVSRSRGSPKLEHEANQIKRVFRLDSLGFEVL